MNRYEARRTTVISQMEKGAIMVLYSGEGIPQSMDDCCPFEANHHFFYLTGLRRENMALVLSRSSSEDKTILFIEEAVPLMERWTGKRLTMEEAKAISGVDDVRLIAYEALEDCMENNMTDWTQLKTRVKDDLSKFLYAKTKRKPMILPVIMNV